MKSILTIMMGAILVLVFTSAIAAQTKKSGSKSKERDLKQPDSNQKNKTTPPKSAADETEETAAVEKPTAAKSSKKESTQRKKVIAISNFFNAATGNEEPQMGKQLVALFYSEFARNGTYEVTAKQQFEEILKAQDISFDERMDARTAAKIGKIASANVFVFGDITEFTLTEDEVEVEPYGKQTKFTAKLGLVVSLVDVNTGVTLKSVNVIETAERSATKVLIFGKKLKMTPDLRNKLFTEAANKAVKSAVEQLSPAIQNNDSQTNPSNNSAAETSTKKEVKTVASNNMTSNNREISTSPKESPKVTRMIKEVVFLSGLGRSAKIGDILSVVRGGREIAVLEITEVNENTAKAKIIEGAGVKANDTVKIIQ